MNNTFQRVANIVAERLGLDVETISMESSFRNDLGADSLDVVDLIMELEDEFDIDISDEEAEKIETVGDVVRYIESL